MPKTTLLNYLPPVIRTFLKSKIHRARVTGTDLAYEGSIRIDSNLLKLANILPNEMVHVWNVTNGKRFETYAIPGPEGSGEVMINGAAAYQARKGDLVIVTTFAQLSPAEVVRHKPRIIQVDERNQPVELPRMGKPLKVVGNG